MLLKNAKAVLMDEVRECDIRVDGGKITEIQPRLSVLPDEEEIDLAGAYLMPGFIDSHTHGAVGELYSDPTGDIAKITAYEASVGVTTVAATLHTMPVDMIEDCAKNFEQYLAGKQVGAKIGGIHMEGPFINVKKKGAMTAEYIQKPTVEYFEKIKEVCGGRMKIMTIAPEIEGALDVIRAGVKSGVKMSAGHTDATFDEMKAGIDAGITRMTHTFNACRALSHREPGVLGAAFTNERVTNEVICDFGHLHKNTVELLYRIKGAEHFTAISDSEFGAGMPEGCENIIDGRHTVVRDGLAYLDDGTICGSASPLSRGAKNLYTLGISLPEIAVMTAYNPAKALGIENETGSIALGKAADLVVLDADFNIKQVFVDGKRV